VIKEVLGLLIVLILFTGNALAAETAPNFTIHDVNTGETHSLSDFRGSVVLLDFMSITCEACDKLESEMRVVWPEYNGTAVFITIDILPTDSPASLKAKGIPWIAGMDNKSIFTRYGVSSTPTVVIVDDEGYVVFKHVGAMSASELRNALDDAIAGRSGRMDITEASIFALALFAGIASFFSPCSFPMLPGYMAYYFGIGKEGEGRYRKAAVGGISAALGIITVYLIIGALLIFFGSAIAIYVPGMGLIVGILLIILGILMFTPLEYDLLLAPFKKIGSKVGKKREHGFAVRLFGYGVGYGAAAAGCTAPLFLAVILGAMLMGAATGISALLIYSLSAGLLMVFITLSMAALENRLVDVLKRNTERIKWISALVLILVGIYLIVYHL